MKSKVIEYDKSHTASARLAGSRGTVASHNHNARRLAVTILVLVDLAVVYVAFVAAYWLRYDLLVGPAIKNQDQLGLMRGHLS